MKRYVPFLKTFVAASMFVFSATTCYSQQQGAPCDSIPQLNQQIISFVNTHMKKKVGRGECWDLASEALKSVNASWNGLFEYGTLLSLKNNCIAPGDIIQFYRVTVKYQKDGVDYREKMTQHTAIVYEVKAAGDYIIADQNTASSGKKVGLHPFNIATIKSGKIKIYRPTK